MRTFIKFSKADILPMIFDSPTCSIIGDEVDGRADALTGICRRGGREEERLLLLLLLLDILSVFR